MGQSRTPQPWLTLLGGLALLAVAVPVAAQEGSPAASTDPAANAGSLSWQKATLPDATWSAPTYLGSIALDADGAMTMVARPQRPTDPSMNAWRSSDGLTWKSVRPADGEQKQQAWAWSGVGTAGGQFVAIGVGGTTFLSDTGAKWKMTKQGIQGARPGVVISTPTGVAVAGSGPAGEAVWTTTDGKAWSHPPFPEGVLPISTMAATPSGLLAAASWSTPELWLAPDGATWQSVPLPFEDASSRNQALTGTGGGLLLAVAQVDENGVPVSATIWSSVDGLSWQQVRSVDSPVTASSFGPLGVVMATRTDLLTSADEGATWTQSPLPAELAGSVVTVLAQTLDGRLLAGSLGPAEGEVAMSVGTPTP